MKRYLPNNYDEFRPHVDVNQKANCTRFLVMFLYLADNKKGKTIFPNLDIEIECKQGSLLMFPPMYLVTRWTKTNKNIKIYCAELFTLCLISKIVMFM